MSLLGKLQCQSSKSWFSMMVHSLVLIWFLGLEKIEKVREERSPFTGGTEGCFREFTNSSDSEVKIASKCPTKWDSRPEGSSVWSLLSMVRFSGFGLWAVNSSMKFVFSFYWKKVPHKVPLQTIKTHSKSWELYIPSGCLVISSPTMYLLPSSVSRCISIFFPFPLFHIN